MYTFTNYRLWLGYLIFLSLSNISMAFAEEGIEYRFERLWPRLEQSWYFNDPSDVAIAPDGSIYIADRKNHRIQHLSAKGDFIQTWGNSGSENGQFSYPNGLAVGSDGSVYVADTFNNRIQQFSAKGEFIKTWGSTGSGDGQFRRPLDIVIASDGIIYVTDENNDRIQKFNALGEFILAWGSKGSGNGQFDQPNSLSIAPDNSIYVTDNENKRIQQFNPDGGFIRTFGGIDSTDEDFVFPRGIAVAPDGSIYVSGGAFRRIQQFDAEGNFIRTLAGNGQLYGPEGLAIAPNGTLFVADTSILGEDFIHQLDSEGNFIQTWGSESSQNGKFNTPEGLSIAPDGTIYIADTNNDRIQQFSANGDFIRAWGNEGSENGQFEDPSAIAIAPDGSVYVADTDNNRIQKFSTNGDFIRTWGSLGSDEGQLDEPKAIAVAPDGSVYVADTDNGRIQKFNANGEYILAWGSNGLENGQFTAPAGIAIAPNGHVYISDIRDIQEFSNIGEFIRAWKSGSIIQNIAIAADGKPYILRDHTIEQFSVDGELIQKIGKVGSGDGQFIEPKGFSISPDGSIFVTDTKNNRIQKFAPKAKETSSIHPYKAIILAGGGEKFGSGRINSIWDGTWRIAQKAYKALTNQAFKTHEEIKFLTAGNTQFDLDRNNKFDDLETATKDSLKIAITEWASDAKDVVIYLSNHGGPGKFKVNGTETLTSEELNDWVSQLEEKIPGKVTLVIEACNSASFFTHLSKPDRFLLASAKADQNAVISNDGFSSFSYTFWSEVATGAEVKTAFENAKQSMSGITIQNEAQSAQAETDGNNVFNQLDLEKLGDYCFGECNKIAGAAPEIKPFSPANQTLNGTTLDFSVIVDSLQPLNTVWAIVQRPDDISIDTNQPLNFEKMDLSCDKENLCKGQYNRFDLKGEYRLSVYALDTQGDISFPETLTLTQAQGNDVYPVQYDESLATVYLRDVEYQGQHYQVALESKGNRFVMVAASPAPQTFNPSARFDNANNLLTIPHALAFGKPYEARFKHLGSFEFELEFATPKK